MRKIFIEKDILNQLYVINNKTVEEISAELKVSKSVISRNLKENNISIRKNKKERINKNLLIELYVDKKFSIRKIASILNVNDTQIRYSLYEHKIERRNKSWKSKEQRNGMLVECVTCGKKVYRKKYLLNKFKIFFCSWSCEKEYQSITRSISELPESWRSRKQYRQWRKQVIKRDNYKCKLCGNSENLVAHHIIEAQNNPDIKFEINNGITLCNICHIEIHRNHSHNYIESLQEAILVE